MRWEVSCSPTTSVRQPRIDKRLACAGRAAIYDEDSPRYYQGGKPTETVVLHSPDGAGESWEVVENFPAGMAPPDSFDDDPKLCKPTR